MDLTKKLINEYLKACRSKGQYKVPISTDEGHKNYKYFEKITQMYGNVPDFDPYIFIEANLRDQIRYPAQLSTKVAFKRFKDYKIMLNVAAKGQIDKEEAVIQAFKNSVDIIVAKVGSYDPKLFFNTKDSGMSPGLAMYIKGLISQYYCMVCKPFWEKIKILDSDINQMFDFEELKVKRAEILSLKKTTLTKLKKIVGDEYWA